MRNTVENVSCEGMPCLSLRKRLRNLSFARPNAAISEQCWAPHSTARNAINRISIRSWREFSALGSGTLSNAVRKSCIADPLESAGVLLRIHYLQLCKPPLLRSNAIPLSIDALQSYGARVVNTTEPELVLDGTAYVSGEIARITPFETGLPGQHRRTLDGKGWELDELIMDERFVAVNVRGKGLV